MTSFVILWYTQWQTQHTHKSSAGNVDIHKQHLHEFQIHISRLEQHNNHHCKALSSTTFHLNYTHNNN